MLGGEAFRKQYSFLSHQHGWRGNCKNVFCPFYRSLFTSFLVRHNALLWNVCGLRVFHMFHHVYGISPTWWKLKAHYLSAVQQQIKSFRCQPTSEWIFGSTLFTTASTSYFTFMKIFKTFFSPSSMMLSAELLRQGCSVAENNFRWFPFNF